MPNAFATISFTESVKAAQTRYGSRENNLGFELSDDPRNELGGFEIEFLAARDSFYQATISENGWPYVQHRGGPKGFMKVLDARTVGFSYFKGNRQYISVGNLNANPRISLIFMDYPNRRRLKIWGTTRIVHRNDEPDLIAKLEVPSYRGRVVFGVVIQVEAIEWNCPQHITQRFTEAEINEVLQPLFVENQRLRALLPEEKNMNQILSQTVNQTIESRPPLPPFTHETAVHKVRMAEDGWNSRKPEKVSLAYTQDSAWRNRVEFVNGREEIVAFLTRKWSKEFDYRLIKELWAFEGNRIAVRFAYEWHDDSGNWFRSYGNENWEFDENGLMQKRFACINDLTIAESERKFHWPQGRRPDDHPSLSDLGL
jgi:nuclear transport factor 2 (NTF2) superfamily protein/predicted pyridoxine 5'-phosphate oxidase superfamily flavin-nucleotide-binding protein